MNRTVFSGSIAALLGALVAISATSVLAQRQDISPPSKSEPKGSSPTLTDEKIVGVIIAASVAAYLALGKPCACPYSLNRAGQACGGRSAHSRPGGESPLCYPRDITPDMVKAYRAGAR